jgi:Cu+-exporting ATPase
MPAAEKHPGNPNCACACNICYCGPNCRCTESLCQCEASSVLNSLSRSPSAITTTSELDPLSTPWSIAEVGVSGMTCSICSTAVERGLKSLDGVKGASCSLATHSVRVEYDRTQVTKQDMLDLIEAIGYEPVIPEVSAAVAEFSISGMTCSMCSQAIEVGLGSVNGVNDVSVSLPTNSARVKYDPSLVEPSALKEGIEDLGYECSLVSATEEDETQDRLEILLHQQQNEVSKRKKSFYWSLIGAFPILFITMILPHTPWHGVNSFLQRSVQIGNSKYLLEALILFVLCTPVQFGCGWPFYKQSYHGIRNGILGMSSTVI